jgi:hypothetical protein
MKMWRILIGLKNSNGDYQRVLEKLTINEYTHLPGNGRFGEDYSSEYELGYRQGLSIFLFPESELARLEERKKNLIKEHE